MGRLIAIGDAAKLAGVIILNRQEDVTFEEDLASDVLEIITVFSARLYGSRSRKNLKIMQKLHALPLENLSSWLPNL